MSDTIVIRLKSKKGSFEKDIAVDINITGEELIQGLNEAYGFHLENLVMFNPPGCIQGSRPLGEYGIHNASIIFCD